MKSKSGNTIKQVNDFKYLQMVPWEAERDMNIRIAKAWSALNSMNVIWKSSLSRKLRTNFFRAAVESVLIWTQTAAMKKMIEYNKKKINNLEYSKEYNEKLTTIN